MFGAEYSAFIWSWTSWQRLHILRSFPQGRIMSGQSAAGWWYETRECMELTGKRELSSMSYVSRDGWCHGVVSSPTLAPAFNCLSHVFQSPTHSLTHSHISHPPNRAPSRGVFGFSGIGQKALTWSLYYHLILFICWGWSTLHDVETSHPFHV